MRVAAILAAVGLCAVPLRAGVATRADGGRVRVEAHAAPLSDILDDLARHTGMKVVYEGAPPRQPITATLERSTVVETLLAVFEGLGLTYVIQLDAAGTGVAKLVMVAGGPRGTTTGSRPAPGRTPAWPVEPAEEPELDEPEAEEMLTDHLDDPGLVVRDRVATDPSTGEAYGVPPDIVPEEPPEEPSDVHVQGYPSPDAQGDAQAGPTTPFQRFSPPPEGFPSPRPQPSPGAP